MNDLILLPKPEKPAAAPRPPVAGWGRLAAGGALLAAIALGWTASGHFDTARATKAETAMAEIRRAAQAQGADLAALRERVETLHGALDAQGKKLHASEATVAALQKTIAEQKSESAAAVAQLQARLDKPRAEAAKATDRTPVASIGKPAPKAARASGAARVHGARDVAGGRVMIEGPNGMEEVYPGQILPGGARVEGFGRGPNWVAAPNRRYLAPGADWDD